MERAVEGKIAAILDRATVVINRGRENGIRRGDRFYVVLDVQKIQDPDTKEDLGTLRRIWGTVEVTLVEEKYCVARVGERNPTVGQWDVGGARRPVELPVDLLSLSGEPTIKVGTLVLMAERKKGPATSLQVE